MVGKTAPIRPQDAERMETISLYCGCLPCLLMGYPNVLTTIEHATERGRRVGGKEQHQWTIGLCNWHHFGKTPFEFTGQTAFGLARTLGAPLSWGRVPFEEDFGDEIEVLVPTQNFLLAEFDRQPWPEYALPRHVARETRKFWMRLYPGPSRFTVES